MEPAEDRCTSSSELPSTARFDFLLIAIGHVLSILAISIIALLELEFKLPSKAKSTKKVR